MATRAQVSRKLASVIFRHGVDGAVTIPWRSKYTHGNLGATGKVITNKPDKVSKKGRCPSYKLIDL